jgi:hypothetical protein
MLQAKYLISNKIKSLLYINEFHVTIDSHILNDSLNKETNDFRIIFSKNKRKQNFIFYKSIFSENLNQNFNFCTCQNGSKYFENLTD